MGGVPYLSDAAAFQNAHINAGDKLVAIDFTATWCGPCKMIGPQFEAMQPQFPHVVFAKVDVDENQEVAMQQGIRSMPTFKFYRRGRQVNEFSGADVARLRAMLAALGGPPVNMPDGASVVAFGLNKRPECNGRRGVVRSLDPATGRYAVDLAEAADAKAETLALKRDNLVQALKVALQEPTDGSKGGLPGGLHGSAEGVLEGYDPETETYSVRPSAGGDAVVGVPIACCQLPVGAVGVVLGLHLRKHHRGRR